MREKRKEKTLTPEMLAGAGDEGISTTPDGEGYNLSIPDFVGKNYHRLSRWCRGKWNGNGQDVLHAAVVIAIERKYGHMTTSLFRLLCQEAARNLHLARWTQDEEKTIILPPTRLAAERLDAYFAVAPADDLPQFSWNCIFAARKMKQAEEKGQLNFWSGGAR